MTLRRALTQLLDLGPQPGTEKIRLEETALCVDCETLTPARGTTCIACGGRALLSLKRVLGGIRPGDSARLVETRRWVGPLHRRLMPARSHREFAAELRSDQLLESAQANVAQVSEA
ncbi:MAG TPA: hypothetical protein VLE48_10940, partial [Terriglobales bacterium]|nr:hypothetical protein [Terriglobales bacterium]